MVSVRFTYLLAIVLEFISFVVIITRRRHALGTRRLDAVVAELLLLLLQWTDVTASVECGRLARKYSLALLMQEEGEHDGRW